MGVGLEEGRAEGRGELGRNDFQHTGAQAAYQNLPRARLGQHVARLEDQETPVGVQQRPALDHHVVGVHSALGHELALDFAEQVPECGRVLDHDRAAGARAMFEDRVDPILAGRLLDLVERAESLHQIGDHVGEKVADLGDAELGFDRLDVVAEETAGLGLEKFPQLLPVLQPESGDLVVDLLEFPRGRGDAIPDALDFRGLDGAPVPHGFEVFEGNRLAVDDGQDIGLHAAG